MLHSPQWTSLIEISSASKPDYPCLMTGLRKSGCMQQSGKGNSSNSLKGSAIASRTCGMIAAVDSGPKMAMNAVRKNCEKRCDRAERSRVTIHWRDRDLTSYLTINAGKHSRLFDGF